MDRMLYGGHELTTFLDGIMRLWKTGFMIKMRLM